jgi:hypothetical protein
MKYARRSIREKLEKLGIRHGHGPRGSNIEELRRTKRLKN